MGRSLHCQVTADVSFAAASTTLLEDLPRVLDQASQAARQDLVDHQREGLLPDGSPFPADIAVGDDVTVDVSDARATWNQAISADARWSASPRASVFAAIGGAFEFSFAQQDPPRTSFMFVGSVRPAPDSADEDVDRLAPVVDAAVGLILTHLADVLAEEHGDGS